MASVCKNKGSTVCRRTQGNYYWGSCCSLITSYFYFGCPLVSYRTRTILPRSGWSAGQSSMTSEQTTKWPQAATPCQCSETRVARLNIPSCSVYKSGHDWELLWVREKKNKTNKKKNPMTKGIKSQSLCSGSDVTTKLMLTFSCLFCLMWS